MTLAIKSVKYIIIIDIDIITYLLDLEGEDHGQGNQDGALQFFHRSHVAPCDLDDCLSLESSDDFLAGCDVPWYCFISTCSSSVKL